MGRRPAFLGVLVALSLTACGSDGGTGPPDTFHLAFVTQPVTAEGQLPFSPIRVALLNSSGTYVDRPGTQLTLSLSVSPTGEDLGGATTVTAVNGVATFSDLSLALPGDGFVLKAEGAGASPVTSDGFSVRLTFQQVGSGEFHTCALTAPGFAYCWGTNLDPVFGGGQLGDGTTATHLTPTPVQGGLRFSQISVGVFHTCGVTTSHAAYCWGSNAVGWLGDGTTEQRSTPTRVEVGVPFQEVSVGVVHTCALSTAQEVYCWGRNSDGQLGDDTGTSHQLPALVAGGRTYSQMDSGGAHGCGVSPGQGAFCWGRSNTGQLGDGTTDTRLVPTRIGH